MRAVPYHFVTDMTTQTEIPPASGQDPFLFDAEGLEAIADDANLRRGLAWFRDQRVVDLDLDEDRLWARVEDEDSEQILSTELDYDPDGNLQVSCDCEDAEHGVCGHAVAALHAYAARAEGAARLLGAADSAIDERIKKGRAEVRVKHLGGEPWFGTWQARSLTPSAHFARSYRVNIRSLTRRANYCSCPDFATNQLGTCKHIEAVLHRISKQRNYKRIKDMPAPWPYVYLAWDLDDAPAIALHRGAQVPEDLTGLLDHYFDAAGRFKGDLPDGFFRFAEQVRDRDDLDLGEDASGHVQRLAAAIARQTRAQEIRSRITSGGGRLPGIRARLYPYQVEGAAFLAANGRALLADDMGLGKTLQTIAASAWLHDNADVERTLVVCPASLKHQWAREIERFTGHSAQVVQGPASARAAQYRREAGFHIINYELALRDLSVINEVLRPDLMVLDEAQRIKNWRTKIAATIKMIPSRYAFVLTGTPLENRLEDLYSLMQVVDPHVLGPLWRYMADFHVTDERGKVLGYRNLSALRRRLAPVMLRRDRGLVSDQLPARIEQRIDVALTQPQRDLHDAAMANAARIGQIAKRRPLTPTEQNRLMAALQQARMACDAAGLVDKETLGSPKLDELDTLLDELCIQGGLKAVVFSQWERMTHMAEQRVRGLGLGCVRLHGGIPTAHRGELMDRFRDDDAVQVFLSTDAGGVGLNLQSASVLINLDVPWNPAVLDQRIARVHRLGQSAKVQVIGMVAVNAYEEQVLALVQGKRQLFDNVVDPEATEDVVGVSKKLIETLIEDLNRTDAAASQPTETPSELAPAPAEAASAPVTEPDEAPVEEAIRLCIEGAQRAFGARIERIVGSGGGLLVVLDRVDDEADRLAEGLSVDIPVAVMDARTLNGLRRLGAASPLEEGRSYYDAAESAPTRAGSRLAAVAQERLKAAEVLLGQQCPDAARELLGSALLGACAAIAGQERAPGSIEAGVWLYGEALPKGWLTQDQAARALRALALVQSPSLPEPMFDQLLEDARGLVAEAG